MSTRDHTLKASAPTRMSPAARTRMRMDEKVIKHYYNDMGKNKGNCTWGAGILAHRGVCTKEELARTVSNEDIDSAFEKRVAEAESYVRRGVTKVVLTQDQFDALVSLTYNAGIGNTAKVFAKVNEADFEGAAAIISNMTSVRIRRNGRVTSVVAPGLVKRRIGESAPFRPTSSKAEDGK